MKQRARKLTGALVLLVFLVVYVLLAMTLGATRLPENGFLQFVYYVVAGLAWVIPAGFLVRWMERAD